MLRRTALLTAALAALGALAAPATAAQAATAPERTTVAVGHDVSYPQCGRALPQRADIAVVGVNAGVGTSTNPCLADQLAWADASGDGPADVYVNTANPGHLGGWWPQSDLTRAGLPVANPAGSCAGAEDEACAYVYGWSIAVDDLQRRGVTSPGARTWWLDVETMNTWSWNRAANLAVLEGMADAVRSAGGSVGIYSTPRQWGLIVGSAAPSSALAGAPGWVAGAITRTGAEENCRAGAFTPGGRIVMAQWVQDDQDHDVACTPGVSGSIPRIDGAPVVGGVLVASPGTWGPTGVRLTYQWLRDGVPIPGATAPARTATAADQGAELALRMRGSRVGAPALEMTSAPVVVRAAPAVAGLPEDLAGGASASSTPSTSPEAGPWSTPTSTPSSTASSTPDPSSSPSSSPDPSGTSDSAPRPGLVRSA